MKSLRATRLLAVCGLFVAAASTVAHAQSSDFAGVPTSAFYAGVGGAATFADFGNQSLYNKGLSTRFDAAGVETGTGTADGPPVLLGYGTTAGLSPVFQLGYFRRFGDSNFLWGTKFSYSPMGNNATKSNVIIPQFGTSTGGAGGSFGGYSVTGGYTVGVYNQMTFTPYIGYVREKTFFYAGIGPSLSQVKTTLNNVVGYATIGGVFTNVSGMPQNFQNESWDVGAAGTIGATYFITPEWFMDFNYTFSAANVQPISSTSGFNNWSTTGGTSYTGTLIGNYTNNVVTHSIGITINRTF